MGGVSPNVQESLLFSLEVSAGVSKVDCNPSVRKTRTTQCMIQPPPFNKAVSHALPDTVKPISTLGAFSHRDGPVQVPVLAVAPILLAWGRRL